MDMDNVMRWAGRIIGALLVFTALVIVLGFTAWVIKLLWWAVLS